MGKYKWVKTEWTCDHCGKKVMRPDRDEHPPTGWFIFDNLIFISGGGSSSKPGNHFCSKKCVNDHL